MIIYHNQCLLPGLVCTSIPHLSFPGGTGKRQVRVGGCALVSGCPEHWTIQAST